MDINADDSKTHRAMSPAVGIGRDSTGHGRDARCRMRGVRRVARLRMIRGAACCIVLAVALLSASSARAGTYLMRSCNVPGQPSAHSGPWKWINLAPSLYANDECGSGGGFGLNAGPMARASGGTVGLETPPSILIRRVRLWMVARMSGTGSALFVTMSSGGASGGNVQGTLFGPPGGETLHEPYVTPPLVPDTTSFLLVLACSGSTNDGCVPASVNPLEIRGAEVTLYEVGTPSGSIEGGSLLSAGPQSGVRTLDYVAADGDSGVAQVTAMLGNTVVAQLDGSDCAYADFAACPRTRSGSLAIDTRKIPDGTYPLLLRFVDAAGNHEAVQASSSVRVANGAASEAGPNGAPAAAASSAALTVRFAGQRGTSAKVSFHKSVTMRGRLTTRDGAPIPGTNVDVSENVTGSRTASRTRAVTTGADGRFTYTSPRRGASRVIRFQYRPANGGGRVAASRSLRINVAASATLRVALKGTRVTYSGRLRTLPAPSKGKLIRVEGRAAGGAWTVFATKRTSKAGRFSGRYSLRVRRPGVRLQFRLRIPTQSGYPYAAGTGAPVTRTVR